MSEYIKKPKIEEKFKETKKPEVKKVTFADLPDEINIIHNQNTMINTETGKKIVLSPTSGIKELEMYYGENSLLGINKNKKPTENFETSLNECNSLNKLSLGNKQEKMEANIEPLLNL